MVKIPNFNNFFANNRVNIDEVYKDTLIAKDFPEILGYLKTWNMQAAVLRGSHILIGGFATFFSVLTATQIGVSAIDDYTKFFAFIAAISIAFLTSFNLTDKSNNTRNAWRLLNVAVIRYNKGEIDKKGLIQAYDDGEKLIGDVLFSRTS